MEGLTVERYIDHGMLEGTGTGNPNWVRDALECGDLSPLLFFGRLVALRDCRQVGGKKSGDKSPHSKAIAKVADQGGPGRHGDRATDGPLPQHRDARRGRVRGIEKGVGFNLCAAPSGPFRQIEN